MAPETKKKIPGYRMDLCTSNPSDRAAGLETITAVVGCGHGRVRGVVRLQI